MAAEKKGKPKRPRRQWTRSPAQKPHSTKHGARGYDRKRDQEEEELDDREHDTGPDP